MKRAKIVMDALIEEHMAVQQVMQEAMESEGEPSEDAYTRLAAAFAKAAQILKEHTVPVPESEEEYERFECECGHELLEHGSHESPACQRRYCDCDQFIGKSGETEE